MTEQRSVAVKDLFGARQAEMTGLLTGTRAALPHAGEVGTVKEHKWIELLATYLPNRYGVRKGFVLDWTESTSEQVDVIVFDQQYAPFLFDGETTCYVPAESVYAIFDAKQELNATTLAETAEKIASVRRLKRTSGPIYTNKGLDIAKSPQSQPILGGVLALTAKWADPLGATFETNLSAHVGLGAIDLGCVLASGAFDVRDGVTRRYPAEFALVGFFLALFRKLQRLGTALAMDLDVWEWTIVADGKDRE